MALYLGNKHISEFYLGDKKIKEAYIGNKKVYPENSSSDEFMFKIIFTDSDGNTYDQLAFRNINTQQVLSLNFRSTDLLNLKDDKFTNFGTINNNTISLNRQEFYQSINSDSGQYLIYIDENNNKLISVSYDATHLKELISGNVVYETETDIKDIYSDGYSVYWEWEGFNINSGYELVGCKNKTSEIITICNDGDENKVSLNKSTIQNNIIRLYLDFDGTTTQEDVLKFNVIITDNSGNTYSNFYIKELVDNTIQDVTFYITSNDVYVARLSLDYPNPTCTKEEFLDEFYALHLSDDNIIFFYPIYKYAMNYNAQLHLRVSKPIFKSVLDNSSTEEIVIDTMDSDARIRIENTEIYAIRDSDNAEVLLASKDETNIKFDKFTRVGENFNIYFNFTKNETPESELCIVMEPSLSFTDSFTTPNGLTLNISDIMSMSELEYDNYLNEDGFYPLTFGINNLDFEFFHGLTVAIFQERTEDSSVAIPNGKVTIYDTADYNFITGIFYKAPSSFGGYQIYELALNDSVTDNEKVSLYAGHSIGRVGMVDSKGKEYKFEFRIPNKTNEPEFTDGYFRYKFRFQDSDEFIGFANENSGIYHTTPVIGLATSASELTSSSIYKNNTVLCMNTGTFVNNSSSSASGNTDIIEDQWFRTTQVIDPQSWIDQGFSWIGFLVYGTTYPFAFVMPLDFITKATENEVYEFSSSEISQIKSVTLDYRASLAHGLQWNSSSINYLFYPTGNTTLNPRVQAVSFDKLNNTLTFILRSW